MKKFSSILALLSSLLGLAAPLNAIGPDSTHIDDGRTYGNAVHRGCDGNMFCLGPIAGGGIMDMPLFSDSLNQKVYFHIEPATSTKIAIHVFDLDTKVDVQTILRGGRASFIGFTIMLLPVGMKNGICVFELIVLTGDGDQLMNRRRNQRFQFSEWSHIAFSLNAERILTVSTEDDGTLFETRLPDRILGPDEVLEIAVHAVDIELPILVCWNPPCTDEVHWKRSDFTIEQIGDEYVVKFTARSLYNVSGFVVQYWDGRSWETIATLKCPRFSEATHSFEIRIPARHGKYRVEAVDEIGALHLLKPFEDIGK